MRLDVLQRAVFDRPGNPLRELFRLAGCAHGDVDESVRRRGLDATLHELRANGVYLTRAEFKGERPIVRNGTVIPAGPGAFVNPLVTGWIDAVSGGSTGAGTRTPIAVGQRLHREAYTALHARELGLEGRGQVHVRPILPAISGFADVMHFARLGYPVEKWFAPAGGPRDTLGHRMATAWLVALARRHGVAVPFPRYLAPNDFSAPALHLARLRARKGAGLLGGFSSPAVRVAQAALERGLDVSGTVFIVGGEALTPAKRRIIESAGGSVYPRYFITEIGAIGFACREMNHGNCVHLFEDSVAVIDSPADTAAKPLWFTTLTSYSPHVLVNAEMGDAAILCEARCACRFQALGFTRQLKEIGTYDKVTAQGVTLGRADMVRLLEEVLPSRFGGGAADYQLVESEARGQTQLTLRVSPRVGAAAAADIREGFLREVREIYGGELAFGLWRHAEGLEVVLEEPLATPAGKVPPVRLLGGAGR